MKTLFSIVILFMLLFVACQSNNTSVKYEHQTVQGLQLEDKFDFQKRIIHRNDRAARFNFSVTSQPNYSQTVVSCVLISGNSIQDMQVFMYPEEAENVKAYLSDFITYKVITEAEYTWLIEQSMLIENRRKLIAPDNAK